MKIGQFAAKHDTSIDTIRHYMSMGLLFPEKNGVQYDFDEACSDDYVQVTELKKIGFTLSEIQLLILYRRIGKLTAYDQRSTYKSYFEKKYRQVEADIQKLVEMKSHLRTIIDDMKNRLEVDQPSPYTPSGLTLDSIKLLSCPSCHEPYEITDGAIQMGLLVNATLTCPCRQALYVKEGIVYTGENIALEKALGDEFDLSHYSEHYIDEYINTTHIDYLRKLHAGLSWSARHMSKEDLRGKIILEPGCGHGYFMRHMIDLFPDSSTYIAVDRNPVKLKWLKQIIERNPPKCKVLFLFGDFASLPIKEASVDMLLDISGSSNYAFEHPDFLLDGLDYLLKSSAKLHGYYILFDNFAPHSKIPPALREGFKRSSIQSHLARLGYQCEEDFLSEPVEKGGPLEDYFVDGEWVRTYLYCGVKSGSSPL